MATDIEIEIDGKKLTAKPNQMILQVADEAGIYIPRFCYHKHLSIAANCRMCLVEVEKSPKALPACATPVMPGMKVFTQSQKTIDAQRAVMEFLLINHPLDCPICDQGGECELQDLSMGYGSGWSHYDECKRSVADTNLGPLISSDMTRCIYCTRCVRFGDEVAGFRELGGVNRGEDTEITTYVQHAIQSEVSGNIIDLCPVGALTSKPYRFTARAWELDQAPSISPHDCLGSNIAVHTRTGKVMRVVSRENITINETWLSDRDRFSYTSLYHPDRLEYPMIKKEGRWEVVDWQDAFHTISDHIKEILNEFGADKIGALASPSSTVEEFYLLQKLMRTLGSPHIDHRLREIDTEDQNEMSAFPGFAIPLTELEQSDAVLLIGSNISKEQPLAGLRVRKAALAGANVLVMNPCDYAFKFNVKAKKIVAPHLLVRALKSLVEALDGNSKDEEANLFAQNLRDKKKCSIVLGAIALHHPKASHIRYLAQTIADKIGAKVLYMTDGANGAGGWLAGAIPHRQAGGKSINNIGLNAYQMLEKPRKAYLLLNVEPDLDFANAAHAIAALKQAKFVVALSIFKNPILEAHANVILPMAPFTETSGTFVNAQGEWQSFTGVASAYFSSRPAWKILRVIGNFLHFDGFNYESSEEIKHEVKSHVEHEISVSHQLSAKESPHENGTEGKNKVSRIGEIPIYAIDSLVRRAKPLQETQSIMEGNVSQVKMNEKTAHHLQLQNGDQVRVKQHNVHAEFSVQIDERVADHAAWIAGGIPATSSLGDLIGEVEIEKC